MQDPCRYMYRLKHWQLKEDEELYVCVYAWGLQNITFFFFTQDLFARKMMSINISKKLLHPCARGLKAEFQESSPFVKSAGILRVETHEVHAISWTDL